MGLVEYVVYMIDIICIYKAEPTNVRCFMLF